MLREALAESLHLRDAAVLDAGAVGELLQRPNRHTVMTAMPGDQQKLVRYAPCGSIGTIYQCLV